MSIIPEELQEKPGPPSLSLEGFSANVHGYAWEPDLEAGSGCMKLWYLSLTASSLEGIKAVWANLIKGEPGTINFHGVARNRFVRLWQGGPGAWKSNMFQLPQAAAHQLILRSDPSTYEAPREDFVLVRSLSASLTEAQAQEQMPYWHMRFMRKRLGLPLLPEWQAWLWRRALDTGEAFRLESSANVVAYRCEPKVETLKADIQEAGLHGELYVPARRAA